MVDTGALSSLVPRRLLRDLGVEPFDSMAVQFANGEIAQWDRGTVDAEMMGRRCPIIVFFGDDESRVLIGAHTLEAFSVDVDLMTGKLVSRPAPMMMLR